MTATNTLKFHVVESSAYKDVMLWAHDNLDKGADVALHRVTQRPYVSVPPILVEVFLDKFGSVVSVDIDMY